MKYLILTISCLIFSACSLIHSDDTSEAIQKRMSNEEIKAAWEKSMEVTEEHKLLESMSGSWNASVKFWTQPGAKPNISLAKSVYKPILNGKFLIEDYKGSFSGQPFEGMSIMGFDSILKTFSSHWADNMGTGAIYSEGKMDPESKVITLKGSVTDPISKSKKPTYSVFKIIDANNHIFEMYDVLKDGNKFKTLEITYQRK